VESKPLDPGDFRIPADLRAWRHAEAIPEARALLRMLAAGCAQVAEGKVRPVHEVIDRIRRGAKRD